MASWWRFEWVEPIWFLLGLLAAVVVTAIWHRSLVDRSRQQQRLSLFIRWMVIGALALALAGLHWRSSTDRRYVVLCVDQSRSVESSDLKACEQFVREFSALRGGHQLRILPFAGDHSEIKTLGVDRQLVADFAKSLESHRPHLDRSATNLEAAIRQSLETIPPDYRAHLVVASDWNETRGSVLRAAQTFGVPISAFILEPPVQEDVQVVALRGPNEARVGEPFELMLLVDARQATSARIELFRDELPVELGSASEVQLVAGENRLTFQQQIDRAEAAHWTARVVAARDQRVDDNQASAWVMASGQPRVLMITSDIEEATWLQTALQPQQIAVEVRSSSATPGDLTEWLEYDAVVLANVASSDLTSRQLDQIRAYVQDFGGGLMMLGGDQSFGLGGYGRTTLETVLPVGCDPDKDEQQPSLAMVLVIDRSGSMGGLKLDLAKDAASAAIELLGPRDQWGVVAFDNEPHWISPLQSAADKSILLDSISRLEAAGGTNLYPALRAAYESLQASSATYKHVLVLSDGVSSPADDAALVAEMVAEQMTVSTIALGDKADRPRLRAMAEQGGGKFYQCDDPRAVPQVFVQETMRASQSVLKEEPFQARLIRHTPVLRSVDMASSPPLLGFVSTSARPTSELVLVTETGEPLLAWWRSGLGMSLAFTSDATNRWAADWILWPDFGTFWAQCVRHVARKRTEETSEVAWKRDGDQFHVIVDLAEPGGAFIEQADVVWKTTRTAAIDRPSDVAPTERLPQEGRFQQTAPGRYEATLPIDFGNEPVLIQATQRDKLVAQRVATLGNEISAELRWKPADKVLARDVSRLTGGVLEPTAKAVIAAPSPAVYRLIPLWKPLVIAAIFLSLVDVAARRIDWRPS